MSYGRGKLSVVSSQLSVRKERAVNESSARRSPPLNGERLCTDCDAER
jgi:hypothetical protein